MIFAQQKSGRSRFLQMNRALGGERSISLGGCASHLLHDTTIVFLTGMSSFLSDLHCKTRQIFGHHKL